MIVINVAEPPWEEFVYRPVAVAAFQWDHTMEDCIPQIFQEFGSFCIKTSWGQVWELEDGDWVVCGVMGKVWPVSNTEFDQYYERKRKG